MALILCLPAAAAQAPSPQQDCGLRTADCVRSGSVALGAPVEEALLSVRLHPGETTDAAGRVLESLGLRTAMDLRLLGGGPWVWDLCSVQMPKQCVRSTPAALARRSTSVEIRPPGRQLADRFVTLMIF